MENGLLLVISGPSGAGKGTVCDALLARNKSLKMSVSVTTRTPRPKETEGKDYYFIDREEFNKLKDGGDLLEYANVHGNFYGTPRKAVTEMMKDGGDVILEIDIQGALQIKEKFEDGVFIFILPPSMDELKKRIVGRGTESNETIMRRFGNAYKELDFMDRYNYVVVNDRVENAAAKIEAIIISEKCAISRNREIHKRLSIEQ